MISAQDSATAALQFDNLIGGTFVRASSGEEDEVLNPATGDVIARVPRAGLADLDLAVEAGRKAFERWSRTTPRERSILLLRLADALEERIEEFAAIESLDVGKTMAQARGEVEEAVDIFRFFAGVARNLGGVAAGDYRENYTSMLRREPLGVVGLISAWNFPLMIAAFKIAPALGAGNVVVFKPSEITPLSTLKFAQLASEIFPPGVVNVLTGLGSLGAGIAGHRGISMVSFTGGSETGRNVARAAAGNLKRVSMELGGNAPVIVLDDADVDALVARLRFVSFVNSGQACTAACRVIAQEGVFEKVLEALVPTIESIRVGDPASGPEIEMGPLVSAAHQQRVLGYLGRTRGEILTGGGAIGDKGFFVQPTLVAGLDQRDEMVQDEIFGPVVTVQRVSSPEQAITYANDVKYGLSGSIWTRDIGRAMSAVQRLDFGQVWVNDHLSSVPEMPNGGFKDSGYGTDSSAYGLEEYTRMKHVWIAVN
ncbi:aldehyde dehydrogenase family protein [Arthrobacter sp. FW306-2-2C-D06B]|uniref:aldehyde dehydrogenase family protein n=1 Tax=Arthrobacter sp. FW306-2-2C-D06B TaxID=2879618 RepID=UPI001F39ED2D|nr:aldehyde dehydrogenase family protein [Arthrobacter sp. FW306-2-2C-D06B]UKA60515.1 aldehyde dehydrogenase family protein [Arthrobacter sp. FW306-2-2C-D06B]